MILDVTKPLTEVGCEEHHFWKSDIDTVSYQGNSANISWNGDIQIKAKNVSKSEALLNISGECVYSLPCDRCLKEVEIVQSIEFEHSVLKDGSDKTQEDDEYTIGHEVNVSELIIKELLLNWPDKVLCKDDCKGLCPVCGSDLNSGTCGCDTFVPDPRWAKLKEFM